MSQLLENPSRKMSIKPNTINSTAQIQNGTTTNALAEKTEQSKFLFKVKNAKK